MSVRPVDLAVAVRLGLSMVMVRHVPGPFDPSARKSDIHLDGLDAAAAHPPHVDLDLRDTQTRGYAGEPGFGGPGRHERAEEHVSADAGGRIQDCETAVPHRLRISPQAAVEANATAVLRARPGAWTLVHRALGGDFREADRGPETGGDRRSNARDRRGAVSGQAGPRGHRDGRGGRVRRRPRSARLSPPLSAGRRRRVAVRAHGPPRQ